MLAALVAAGELPPVEERVPQDPAVIEPFQDRGHGGTLRMFTNGPGPCWHDSGGLGGLWRGAFSMHGELWESWTHETKSSMLRRRISP
jgi:hypothetical protein